MLKRTVFLTLILLLIGVVTAVSGQEPNRAALVVLLDSGESVTRCVHFEEDEITGLELVNRSELDLVTSTESMGPVVCSVEGSGCPANDCFCQCKGGGDCVYWSYWHLREGQWSYSQAGAASFQVQDGMVEGWTWGPGTPQNALEPLLVTFDEVCAVAVEYPVIVPTEMSEEPVMETTAVNPIVAATAVPVPEPTASNPTTWWGYALLGLIVVGLGGLLLVRGRKEK